MSGHVHLPSSPTAVCRRDLRRRYRRAALLGLLPRLRRAPSPMRPAAGAVIFA